MDNIYVPVKTKFTEEERFTYDMSRGDCINWLKTNFPEINTPRSACICCPYRSDLEWVKIKEEQPEVFEQACDFDDRIRDRHKTLNSIPFMHSSLVPLRIVKFSTNDKSNIEDECQGLCGN